MFLMPLRQNDLITLIKKVCSNNFDTPFLYYVILKLREFRNYSLITRCALSDFAKDFCAEWQINIHA